MENFSLIHICQQLFISITDSPHFIFDLDYSIEASCNNVAPVLPSVVSGYGERSINLKKVVALPLKSIHFSAKPI
jgi:hypothetical protein